MPVGKRIYLKRNLPNKDLLDGFSNIPTSNIGDCMNRLCAMNPRIRLISKPSKPVTVGTAYTVRVRAGDNLALHAALTFCSEGDFIIVSNEEEANRAIMGEVMMTYLTCCKKAAGIVIDGPIRDIGELSTWDFPIYCTGSTPSGPFKNGPGEVNIPISCGGLVVNPGDIIVADADGVIAISPTDAQQILEKAREYMHTDQAKIEKTKQGIINRDWVLKALEKEEFEIIDGVFEQ